MSQSRPIRSRNMVPFFNADFAATVTSGCMTQFDDTHTQEAQSFRVNRKPTG
jgi:hypothetical protein